MTRNSKIGVLRGVWRARGRRLSPIPPAIAAPDTETLNRMRVALETMDEMQRAVFERVRFEGLHYQQIGAELGLTIREVERHLASALLHIWRYTDGEQGQ